jgi:hypothetical protein
MSPSTILPEEMSEFNPSDLEGVLVHDQEREEVFEITSMFTSTPVEDSMASVEYESGVTGYVHYLELNLFPRYQRVGKSDNAS